MLSFLVRPAKNGVTGIGTEYRDSPEEEVTYSTWRRSLWNGSQKETGTSRLKIYLVCVHLEKAFVCRWTKHTDKMILNSMGMCSKEFKTLFCFLIMGVGYWREGGNEIA